MSKPVENHWYRAFCKLALFCVFRFGRHPVLILSVIFMLIFGMTVAFSVNVPMFSTLRFFEGFCLAGITLSLYALSKCSGFGPEHIYGGFIRQSLCNILHFSTNTFTYNCKLFKKMYAQQHYTYKMIHVLHYARYVQVH